MISVESKIRGMKNRDIQLVYTPGVAAVCESIRKNPALKYSLTSKANNVAIVTDGTRILGLGNIGPYAALPVMEGKAVLYKRFGGVDAFPICLNTTRKEEIVSTIKAIEPAFGAINLEDIESPKALEIADELEKELAVPVFHDDQHGTAIVTLAALINALRLTGRRLGGARVVVAGAGSAGYGICRLLHFVGFSDMVVVDSAGAIHAKRKENMTSYKKVISKMTNPGKQKGSLGDVIKSADVFIGVSGTKNILSAGMIRSMSRDPIVFALTNPEPEVDPRNARRAGAAVVATGSYNYRNRVNNAIVFPYLMRAVLDRRIKRITQEMMYRAAKAIADVIPRAELGRNNIVPEIGNAKLQKGISSALRGSK